MQGESLVSNATACLTSASLRLRENTAQKEASYTMPHVTAFGL